jgi:SAM-dependent methyltransferase
MNETEVKEKWARHWSMGGSIEENSSFIGNYLRKWRLRIMREMLASLDKSLSVVDVGCGNGSTLQVIRDAGFANSIGIELIEDGIKHAVENGFKRDVDIFQMDAEYMTYPDRKFDLVFSEGLFEHFIDPVPFMKEFARVSGKYVMVIQPNHYSIVGRLLKIGWDLLESKKGGVVEYSFRMSYFTDHFASLGFKLIDHKSTPFNEQVILLYQRV